VGNLYSARSSGETSAPLRMRLYIGTTREESSKQDGPNDNKGWPHAGTFYIVP
jgi:hypothetical protein